MQFQSFIDRQKLELQQKLIILGRMLHNAERYFFMVTNQPINKKGKYDINDDWNNMELKSKEKFRYELINNAIGFQFCYTDFNKRQKSSVINDLNNFKKGMKDQEDIMLFHDLINMVKGLQVDILKYQKNNINIINKDNELLSNLTIGTSHVFNNKMDLFKKKAMEDPNWIPSVPTGERNINNNIKENGEMLVHFTNYYILRDNLIISITLHYLYLNNESFKNLETKWNEFQNYVKAVPDKTFLNYVSELRDDVKNDIKQRILTIISKSNKERKTFLQKIQIELCGF